MIKVLAVILSLPLTYAFISITLWSIKLPDYVGAGVFSIVALIYVILMSVIAAICRPELGKEELLRHQAVLLIEKEEREKDLKAQEVREKALERKERAREKKILDTMERIKNKKE
jgi:hypothetical protein